MHNMVFHFSVSYFRSRLLAVILLAAFFVSFMPVAGIAQSPTATIQSLSGAVLASGQPVTVGAVLNAGDTIETQAGAAAVLALSDGSILRLGENTQVNLADLTQTPTGARVSWLKLLRGRIRALLSPDHQKTGSSFFIETPNAQVGLKFSQPDVEVSYDPAKQETIGIAHTVELIAINLLTNEKITVPVGSTVIIVGLLMKIVPGTAASVIPAWNTTTETSPTGTETTTAAATAAKTATTGMSMSTKVAIGAGVAVVAGGVLALTAGSGGGGDGAPSNGGGYSVRDLQGTWDFTSTYPGFVTLEARVTFDAQGNITAIELVGSAGTVSSISGNYTVAADGTGSGTVSYTINWPWGTQDNIERLTGRFISRDRIEGTDTLTMISGGFSTTIDGTFVATK